MEVNQMTGKQVYDETKRLKAEREYRLELKRREHLDNDDLRDDREQEMFNLAERFVSALEKIAARI